jgi:hypothetical protein
MDRSALDAKYAEIPKGRKGFLYQRELLSHRCRYQRKFLLKEKLSPTPACHNPVIAKERSDCGNLVN